LRRLGAAIAALAFAAAIGAASVLLAWWDGALDDLRLARYTVAGALDPGFANNAGIASWQPVAPGSR